MNSIQSYLQRLSPHGLLIGSAYTLLILVMYFFQEGTENRVQVIGMILGGLGMILVVADTITYALKRSIPLIIIQTTYISITGAGILFTLAFPDSFLTVQSSLSITEVVATVGVQVIIRIQGLPIPEGENEDET